MSAGLRERGSVSVCECTYVCAHVSGYLCECASACVSRLPAYACEHLCLRVRVGESVETGVGGTVHRPAGFWYCVRVCVSVGVNLSHGLFYHLLYRYSNSYTEQRRTIPHCYKSLGLKIEQREFYLI